MTQEEPSGTTETSRKAEESAGEPLLEVLHFPSPELKRKCEPIERVDDSVRALAEQMLRVMYDEPGIGLAAPQVGHAIRLVVMDTTWSNEGAKRNPTVIVNPQILERSGKVIWEEGCLSVPDYTADVERAANIVVRYHDLDGEELVENVSDLRAVCFQHEIDHLDGILFIDRISRLKRSLYVKRRKKQLRSEEADAAGYGG